MTNSIMISREIAAGRNSAKPYHNEQNRMKLTGGYHNYKIPSVVVAPSSCSSCSRGSCRSSGSCSSYRYFI